MQTHERRQCEVAWEGSGVEGGEVGGMEREGGRRVVPGLAGLCHEMQAVDAGQQQRER